MTTHSSKSSLSSSALSTSNNSVVNQDGEGNCFQRVCCKQNRWVILRVMILFIFAVVVLVAVYKAKGTRILNEQTVLERQKSKYELSSSSSSDMYDSLTHDRWVVLQAVDSNLPYSCAIINVAVTAGWRPLVLGEQVSCCIKPHCILLHNLKRARQFFHILSRKLDDISMSQRNLAYLYAIQHGARFLFDAYSDIYEVAGVKLENYTNEVRRQFQTLTLEVALGLVYERPYVRRVYNPYSHFGRSDLWTPGFKASLVKDFFQLYRICEARPPSMETFLEVDSDFVDSAAPSIILPGDTVAPFSTKNTMYSSEAFWALPLLPSESPMDSHLFRGLWNHALLGDIAGSVKLSLAEIPTLQRLNEYATTEDKSRLSSFLLKWRCQTRSALHCVLQLAKDLHNAQFFTKDAVLFLESWVADLRRVHYMEPPIVPRRRGHANPCLGADGLYGVSFFPSLQPASLTSEQLSRRNISLHKYSTEEYVSDWFKKVDQDHEDATRRTKSENYRISEAKPAEPILVTNSRNNIMAIPTAEFVGMVNIGSTKQQQINAADYLYQYVPVQKEIADEMCNGFSELLPFRPKLIFSNILLIIAFTNLHYDQIPLFEVIYRTNFPHILYCGLPHESTEIFLRKYQLAENRSFSFLPTHSKSTYECVLGALEMGYQVDGYFVVTDQVLLNTWNIANLDIHKWAVGSTNLHKVTKKEFKHLDPGGQKLKRGVDGMITSWKFIAYLLGSLDHYHYLDLKNVRRRNVEEFDDMVQNDDTKTEREGTEATSISTQIIDNITSSALISDVSVVSISAELLVENSGLPKVSTDDAIHPDIVLKSGAPFLDLLLSHWEEGEIERDKEDANGDRIGYHNTPGNLKSESNQWNNSNTSSMNYSNVVDEQQEVITVEIELHNEDKGPCNIHSEQYNSNNITKPNIQYSEFFLNDCNVNNQTLSKSEIRNSNFENTSNSSSNKGTMLTSKKPATTNTSKNIHLTDYLPSIDHSLTTEELYDDVEKSLGHLHDIYSEVIQTVTNSSTEHNEDSQHHHYSKDAFRFRLKPKEFRHLRCDKEGPAELCGLLRQFILQLSESVGRELRLFHDNIPVYYVPTSASRSFYLIANILLHHGVLDDLALPLLLRGLAGKTNQWQKLVKSHFGFDTTLQNESKYPLFDDKAAYLYPVNVHGIYDDKTYQRVFCLKYLLQIFKT